MNKNGNKVKDFLENQRRGSNSAKFYQKIAVNDQFKENVPISFVKFKSTY